MNIKFLSHVSVPILLTALCVASYAGMTPQAAYDRMAAFARVLDRELPRGPLPVYEAGPTALWTLDADQSLMAIDASGRFLHFSDLRAASAAYARRRSAGKSAVPTPEAAVARALALLGRLGYGSMRFEVRRVVFPAPGDSGDKMDQVYVVLDEAVPGYEGGGGLANGAWVSFETSTGRVLSASVTSRYTFVPPTRTMTRSEAVSRVRQLAAEISGQRAYLGKDVPLPDDATIARNLSIRLAVGETGLNDYSAQMFASNVSRAAYWYMYEGHTLAFDVENGTLLFMDPGGKSARPATPAVTANPAPPAASPASAGRTPPRTALWALGLTAVAGGALALVWRSRHTRA